MLELRKALARGVQLCHCLEVGLDEDIKVLHVRLLRAELDSIRQVLQHLRQQRNTFDNSATPSAAVQRVQRVQQWLTLRVFTRARLIVRSRWRGRCGREWPSALSVCQPGTGDRVGAHAPSSTQTPQSRRVPLSVGASW